MRGRFREDLFGGFCRIHRDDFGEESCDFGYANLSAGPRSDDFGNRFQSEACRNPLGEFRRRLRIDRAERCAYRLAADPKAAALVTEIRTPTADAEHRSLLVTTDGDRARAGDQEHAGIDTNRANGRNERVAFDNDLGLGDERLQQFSIERHTVWPAGAGESAADDVRALREAAHALRDSFFCGFTANR